MRLENKIAIVTGAGSGMGKTTVELFAREGAKVVVADIAEDRVNDVVAGIKDAGGEAVGCIANVASRESVEAMFRLAISTWGRFDIIVNNAGIMDGMEGIEDIAEERWDKVFAVNVKSLLYSCQYAVRYFKENGIKGVIVNNLSDGGLRGAIAGVAYTASKHAGVGITRNTAFMYAPDGIRCNAIAPGAVKTNIAQSMTGVSEAGYNRVKLNMANLPGQGELEQLAQAMLFLASDESSFVNGVIMPVDGGWDAA